MKTQKITITSIMVILCLAMFACSSTRKGHSQKEVQRDLIRAMAQQTLFDLYKNEPAAKSAVAVAAGYAVFSDFGFKVMAMEGAHGKGVAVSNASKQETFMKLMELEPGMGVGAQNYRLVFIFENLEAFNEFVTSGYELSTDTMTAAELKYSVYGETGALSLTENVKMYQLSDTGAIVGVSITSAKYFKDDDLN